MNEDYTQPFYVPYEMAKRLGHDRPFYLPALEPPEEHPLKETQETEWSRKQWDAVNQMKAGYIHLQKKLNEHLDKKKPKSKYD